MTKTRRVLALKVLTIGLLINVSSGLCTADQPDSKQPNVIIIYGDDIGYGDFGCCGGVGAATPSIDSITCRVSFILVFREPAIWARAAMR